jgi:hypothetical protein
MGSDNAPKGVTGSRHGHRGRGLLGTFGATTVRVPRAQLATPEAIPLRIRLRKGSASKVAGFYSATRDRVMPPLRGLWYSLQGDAPTRTARIVLPEHHDRRYVFTLVDAKDSSVIIGYALFV